MALLCPGCFFLALGFIMANLLSSVRWKAGLGDKKIGRQSVLFCLLHESQSVVDSAGSGCTSNRCRLFRASVLLI
jgi:hypothetical protein